MGSGTFCQYPYRTLCKRFQSTHSVGSGTLENPISSKSTSFQSTHSVGSGTQCVNDGRAESEISIHPLRGEWDPKVVFSAAAKMVISIHPLRGEWDCQDCSNTLQFQYFNPPTPWGVGRRRQFYTALIGHFNPPTPWGVGLSVHFAY